MISFEIRVIISIKVGYLLFPLYPIFGAKARLFDFFQKRNFSAIAVCDKYKEAKKVKQLANSILTPQSLWRDFNDKLPLNEFIVKRETEENVEYSFVCFSGRQTKLGRVRIYSLFARPVEGKLFPALLLLPDAGKAFDKTFIRRCVERGYAVLAVDYSGKAEGRDRYTVYPDDVFYANFQQAGRYMDYVDTDARETSWFEWTAVGLYALQYLKGRPDVGKIGVVGVRTGGEIAWKLMLSPDICCGIPICAAGWLVYKGINKFGKKPEIPFDDERQRFLAGIDSQSYASFVNCAVLMLCSTNDPRFDYDRAYDTYTRIGNKEDCVISYTVNNSSYIGAQGLNDFDMFLDKYLKNQQVFIPIPLNLSIEIDETGELVATVNKDKRGEVKQLRVFMSEDCLISSQRDWREMKQKKSESEEKVVFLLNAYENAKMVFAFAQAEYSSGFTSSSKIAVKNIDAPFTNGIEKSRVIYMSEENGTECFAVNDVSDYALCDCIITGEISRPKLIDGYKGIRGISSDYGLKTYRINNPVCRPSEEALISADFCSWESGMLEIVISQIRSGETLRYAARVWLKGSNGWENHVLHPNDFKTALGTPLASFSQAISLAFRSDVRFCVNNILWL